MGQYLWDNSCLLYTSCAGRGDTPPPGRPRRCECAGKASDEFSFARLLSVVGMPLMPPGTSFGTKALGGVVGIVGPVSYTPLAAK